MAAPSSNNWTGNSKRRNLEEGKREASTRYWPEDVIREILVRLPIKSILRFKSTSKNWHALIRSRSFIDFHRTRRLDDDDHADELFFSRNHSNRHVYTPEEEPYIISFLSYCSSSGLKTESTPLFDLKMLRQALAGGKVDPPLKKTFLVDVPGIYVLGPLSNGISCVIALEFVENTRLGEAYCYCKIAFCNLSTREFNVLRDPFPFPRRGFGFDLLFYFEHSYGFGSIQNHDGVAVDYKMVVIEHNKHNQSFRAAVYSQRRGSWKLISPKVVGEHEFPKITQALFRLPVQALLNGSCHWMAKKKQSNSNGSQQHCILQSHLTKIHSCKLHLQGHLLGRVLGMSFSRADDGGTNIDKIFFQQSLRNKNLISCDGSGYKKHSDFEHQWAIWKPLGLSPYVETLQPVSLTHTYF